jgi:hypothetical protein
VGWLLRLVPEGAEIVAALACLLAGCLCFAAAGVIVLAERVTIAAGQVRSWNHNRRFRRNGRRRFVLDAIARLDSRGGDDPHAAAFWTAVADRDLRAGRDLIVVPGWRTDTGYHGVRPHVEAAAADAGTTLNLKTYGDAS